MIFESPPAAEPPEEPAAAGPPVQGPAPTEEPRVPPRKWSLVILAVTLFVLVWVREFTAMDSSTAIAMTVFMILAWLVVHMTFFVDPAELTVEMPDEAQRWLSPDAEANPEVDSTTDEDGFSLRGGWADRAETEPPRRDPRRWRGGLLGIMLGIVAALMLGLHPDQWVVMIVGTVVLVGLGSVASAVLAGRRW